MKILEFVRETNAMLDKHTTVKGQCVLKISSLLKIKNDLNELRKSYFLGDDNKSNIYFVASVEWWNKKGLVSISKIAQKYELSHESLSQYIDVYLSLKDKIKPFSKCYSIFELYYFTKYGFEYNNPEYHD